MNFKSKSSFLVLSLLVIIGLYAGYRYFSTTQVYNVLPKTTTLNLKNKNAVYLLEKHAQQGGVYQLEMTFQGRLSDNITVHLSKDGIVGLQSIRIKKGNVKTSFIARWENDNAYLLIENPIQSENQLELEYQFVSE